MNQPFGMQAPQGQEVDEGNIYICGGLQFQNKTIIDRNQILI